MKDPEHPPMSNYEAILRQHRDRAYAEAAARIVPGAMEPTLRLLVDGICKGVWCHAVRAAEDIYRLTRDEPDWLMADPEPAAQPSDA